MKTRIYALLFVVMASFTWYNPSMASIKTPVNDPVKTLSDEEIAIRMTEMRKRVEEIKSIDRSSLTKEERKALKKELRDMNKEARAFGERGVYLSVGAIIIIILLLILIL